MMAIQQFACSNIVRAPRASRSLVWCVALASAIVAAPQFASGASTTADRVELAQAATDQAWRLQLLDFALDVANRVPTQGHERDRARLQELTGLALLDAGMPDRAATCARMIDGWRRGSLLAAIALEQAKRSDKSDDARALATQALAARASTLDWQRERINAMVARVYALLGDDTEANRLEKGLGEPEMGKVAATRAARFPAADFDAQTKMVDEWLATKNFDLVRNAADVSLELYSGNFADATRRSRIEAAVAAANAQLPFDLRIANLLRLSDMAHKHADVTAANAFIDQAQAQCAAAKWLVEDELVQLSAIAGAKARAGNVTGARKDLEAAVAKFDSARGGIVDIFRAQALRPIAEAYALLGDGAMARAVYGRALTDGASNANARPRADDLVLTSISMSRMRIEPDAAMDAQMRAIRDGLVQPW